jgi:hypothetical protein
MYLSTVVALLPAPTASSPPYLPYPDSYLYLPSPTSNTTPLTSPPTSPHPSLFSGFPVVSWLGGPLPL